MSEGIEQERKALGLAVRTNDPMSNVSGDEQLFKFALINPIEPMGVATFEQEVFETDEDGVKTSHIEKQKRNVPRLVSTMALGNLNGKEVELARIFSEMSRMCAWHGYNNLAITYYLKVVHLNVTSQSYQSQLLRQILTETVSVSRKEESLAGTRDFTGDKSNKVQDFIEKWKNKAPEGQSGQQGTAQTQTNYFGLK